MKHLKILTLAAMACAALMAFASTASATTLSNGSGNLPAGTVIKGESKAKTSAVLEDTSGLFQNTCTLDIEGKTTNETGATVNGEITSLIWTNCTHPTKTLANGNLSVAWTSGGNGTISGSGTEVETEVAGGGVCHYGTGSGITLGTVDGAGTNTSHAIITINTVVKLLATTSGFCPESARWTAEVTVTSPVGLKVTN